MIKQCKHLEHVIRKHWRTLTGVFAWIDGYNGAVRTDASPTITTRVDASNMFFVNDPRRRTKTALPTRENSVGYKLVDGHIRGYDKRYSDARGISERQICLPIGETPTILTSRVFLLLISDERILNALRKAD